MSKSPLNMSVVTIQIVPEIRQPTIQNGLSALFWALRDLATRLPRSVILEIMYNKNRSRLIEQTPAISVIRTLSKKSIPDICKIKIYQYKSMMYLLLFKKLFGMTCLKMNTILKRDFRLTNLIGQFQKWANSNYCRWNLFLQSDFLIFNSWAINLIKK